MQYVIGNPFLGLTPHEKTVNGFNTFLKIFNPYPPGKKVY
jgi:hypothetical protein